MQLVLLLTLSISSARAATTFNDELVKNINHVLLLPVVFVSSEIVQATASEPYPQPKLSLQMSAPSAGQLFNQLGRSLNTFYTVDVLSADGAATYEKMMATYYDGLKAMSTEVAAASKKEDGFAAFGATLAGTSASIKAELGMREAVAGFIATNNEKKDADLDAYVKVVCTDMWQKLPTGTEMHSYVVTVEVVEGQATKLLDAISWVGTYQTTLPDVGERMQKDLEKKYKKSGIPYGQSAEAEKTNTFEE